MEPERATRTVSLKLQGNDPNAIMALVKVIEAKLPGSVKITSGIRSSDKALHNPKTRFEFDFYCYGLVTFELTAGGEARLRPADAIRAFQEERVRL